MRKVGRASWPVRPLGICALFLSTALSAPAATFYVTISGLGGEPDYEQRF